MKAKELLEKLNQIMEIEDSTAKDFARKSGKSEKEVKDLFKEIEKGVSKSVSKEDDPDKFFAIVFSQLKKQLGIS